MSIEERNVQLSFWIASHVNHGHLRTPKEMILCDFTKAHQENAYRIQDSIVPPNYNLSVIVCPTCERNYGTCPCYLPDEPIHQMWIK